jgi:hypothetical protein
MLQTPVPTAVPAVAGFIEIGWSWKVAWYQPQQKQPAAPVDRRQDEETRNREQ